MELDVPSVTSVLLLTTSASDLLEAVRRLRRDTGRFTCLHLTDLDTAVLTSASLANNLLRNAGADCIVEATRELIPALMR